MATAHGAGLMLRPALMSLCLAASPSGELTAIGIAARGAGRGRRAHGGDARGDAAIAVCVYEWLGLAFLRRGWINFDFIWIAALAITGIILIVSNIGRDLAERGLIAAPVCFLTPDNRRVRNRDQASLL